LSNYYQFLFRNTFSNYLKQIYSKKCDARRNQSMTMYLGLIRVLGFRSRQFLSVGWWNQTKLDEKHPKVGRNVTFL
jgi:hypothetical protein